MKIVIFVSANSTNRRQGGTVDGTRDVIINIHFIISTNLQTNESWVNLLRDFNLSTTNRKQYSQQEFMKEKL